jgi:tripartite-type tricarboxylate transporter receptor subunit TctC
VFCVSKELQMALALISFFTLIVTSSSLFSPAAFAQAYPARPITVIVPFAAGGPVDTDTRRYGAKLSEMLGQPVVVDYKPGAGTSIGAAFVAKAKPDGYTLLSDSSAFAVFPAFYKDLKFDPLKDLVPIMMMNELVSVLLVPPTSPLRRFSDYLAYTKNNPGKLSYGTSGVGDISHVSAAWMHSIAGTKVTFVPYKGNGPMLVDLLAGRVDAGSASLVQALPHIRAGKLRAIAIRGPTRVKPLPDLPAVNEHPGMKEFASVNWLGFFAPGATPAPVIDRLASSLIAISKMPDIVAELEAQASTPVGSTSAEFRALVTEEIARWKKVVSEAGMGT